MASVKVFLKNSLPSLTSLVYRYREDKIKRLLDFSTAKSKEYGIISNSSTVVADMRVNSTNARKFFKKIYTTLYGQVLKKVPYMDFLERGDIELHYNRMQIKVPLFMRVKSINKKDLVDKGYLSDNRDTAYGDLGIDSVARFLSEIGDDGDLKTLKRYTRYINRLAAKEGCPIRISMHSAAPVFGDIPIDTKKPLKVWHHVTVVVDLGSWYRYPNRTHMLFSEFENQRDNYSSYPACSVFNLFTFFEDIPKVIRTFSRKGYYNANAYVV